MSLHFLFLLFLVTISSASTQSPSQEMREWMKDEIIYQFESLTHGNLQQIAKEFNEECTAVDLQQMIKECKEYKILKQQHNEAGLFLMSMSMLTWIMISFFIVLGLGGLCEIMYRRNSTNNDKKSQ